MRVMYVNNDGGGFADFVEVPHGTVISKFFRDHVPGGSPQAYLIRVNRLPVSGDQILQEGDRISITPTRIEGARA